MGYAAIVFTRHELTEEQFQEIEKHTVGGVVYLRELASLSLKEWEDVEAVANEIIEQANKIAKKTGAVGVNVYGVFPTPLLYELNRRHDSLRTNLPLYSAWNINRAPEGEKPRFEHHGWLCIGGQSYPPH
jgi:hypothetical protein